MSHQLLKHKIAEHDGQEASWENYHDQERIRREQEFQTVVENSPDLIARVDGNCRFIYANPAFENLLGVPSKLLTNKRFSDVLPKISSVACIQQKVQEVVRTGSSVEAEMRWTTPEGERIFDMRNIPEQDESGKVCTVLCIGRDITERQQHEEILRHQVECQSRVSAVTNVLPAAIFQFRLAPDGKMSIPYSSPGIRELYGFNPEDLTEDVSPAWALIHPHDLPRVRGAVMESARTLEPFSREWRIRHPTKGEIWVECRSVTEREPDGSVVWYGYMQDITERKHAQAKIDKLTEELERRVSERTAQLEMVNKELEAFNYSVSHDLRAPLRSINGFSQGLLNEYAIKLDPEGKSSLENIVAAGHRMAELIEDLLRLSHLTRTELRRVPVDLSAMAREVTENLKKADPGRMVECVIEPGLNAKADRNLIRVVLENLLGNAWKFTRREPAARIELGRLSRKGTPVYFVRDNGAGFDMAYAHRLFGAFQRLHSAADFPGTGIGLATVRRIIQRHCGQVWAEGGLGRGATFYFTLSHKFHQITEVPSKP